MKRAFGVFFLFFLFLSPAISKAESVVFIRPLYIGVSGADVSVLQQFLKTEGYFTYPVITGYYGPITFNAVAQLQAAHNLEQVGTVGPLTRALLNAAEAASSTAAASTTQPATIPFPTPLPGYAPGQIIFIGGGSSSSPSDTSAPSISLTTPSNSATVSGRAVTLSATASDNVGVVGVQFKVDDVNAGAEVTSAPYSIAWDSTSVADGTHNITAVARDSAGNTTTSGAVSVTVDNSAPVISSISSGTPSNTTATITWDTDESANSEVVYGLTSSYGSASTSAAFVTSHSIGLTGLTATTTYHYAVVSVDSHGNTATSSDQTLATLSDFDAGPVNAQSYTFAATRLQLPTSSAVPTSGQEIMTSSVGAGTPAYPTSNPRIFFPSFYAVTGGGDDTPLENSFTILGASIKVGSTWYPLYFSGATSTVIDPSSSVGVWSDPATTTGTIPANSIVQIRTAFEVNPGQKMLTGMIIGAGDWAAAVTEGQGFYATPALAIAKLTDNLSVGTNGRISGFMYGPAGMVAQGWDGRSVVLVTGDSIARGIASSMTFANARGDYGYIDTGLDDASSSTRLPFWNISAPGTNPSTGPLGWGNRANFSERLDAIKLLPNRPFTMVIDEHGSNSTNDNGGVGAQYTAGLRASEIEMNTMLRNEYGYAVPMYQTTITPKVQSSTDRFSSLAGQTVTGGSLDSTTTLSGGALWQFNNELETGYSSVFGYNGYIKVWDAVSYDTGANRQYWAVPSFTATVASNYATTSSSIVLSAAPAIGELLVFDPGNTNGIANAQSVSGTGPYTVGLTAHLSVAYTTGTAVGAAYTSDGTHPSPTAHALLAAKLIQWKNSLGL